MSNYTIQHTPGEYHMWTKYHVWTKSGNWVAWFKTEEQAKEFVARADRYEHEPFNNPSKQA